MSLHYVLDGYNLIKNSNFPLAENLRDQRLALLNFIVSKAPCGSPNNKVSVVFDAGASGLDPARDGIFRKRSNLEVIFSHEQTADDKIKAMVSASANPKRIVVVSDDRDIQRYIKSYGAKPVKVKEFFGKIKFAEKKIKISPKIELTYSQAEKINRELKKVWLK